MKKTITQEIEACDICEHSAFYTCLNCGKQFCWDCAEKFGKEYNSGVYFTSGSGFYCRVCDKILSSSGMDVLHNAYKAIEETAIEFDAINAQMTAKKNFVEQQLEKLLEERKEKI